jgi:hypothetical protein
MLSRERPKTLWNAAVVPGNDSFEVAGRKKYPYPISLGRNITIPGTKAMSNVKIHE